MKDRVLAVLGVFAVLSFSPAQAAEFEEYRVKREAVFEFAEKPVVTRAGDTITIAFETKGFCDVTVAIENAQGKITRHLACGVLGPKAPEPFQKNSKRQTLIWDGKDDQDVYVDDKDSHSIRVSLGLKPQFEKTLFWSPYKRVGGPSPVPAASPDGVYLSETYMMDHGKYGGTMVRFYDHQGNYVRTVYPFPANKLDQVQGLPRHAFGFLGKTLPLKIGYYQSSFLDTGTQNCESGTESNGFAVQGNRLALAYRKLVRLGADGSTPRPGSGQGGGLPLGGGRTGVPQIDIHGTRKDCWAVPRSAAFSPDGKSVYLAGYNWYVSFSYGLEWLNGVMRLDYEKNGDVELFAGKMAWDGEGSDDASFKVPASVACDARGRVYVADHGNDRIQVFTPEGKLFKSIPAQRPVDVAVHQKTGEIYVFSWYLFSRFDGKGPNPQYTRMGPVEDPKVITRCDLPLIGHNPTASFNYTGNLQFRTALDSWADEPTIWLVPAEAEGYSTVTGLTRVDEWRASGVRLLTEKDGKLVLKRDFSEDSGKAVVRRKPPARWRQRMYVNPASGKLYVGESDCGVNKAFNQVVEIDPATGRVKLVDLPMGCEDMCFDVNGLLYLRTDTIVVRYDPKSWREIPWDYGEERRKHSFGMGAKAADILSGLATPGHRSFNFWHLGGMDVSLKGHLVVTTCNGNEAQKHTGGHYEKQGFEYVGRPYTPQIYPGRMRWGEIHIWDQHGKVVMEDSVPGMGHLNGIGIDQDDNLYMLSASRRILEGKLYDPSIPDDRSGTVLKVKAGKSKTLSNSGGIPVPLGEEIRPKRSLDLGAGFTSGWVEGAEWFYGGIGFCTPGGCVCANCRFDTDYFNRSFAPESPIFSVAVLDSVGNLITRIGQYGNVDDGKPLVPDGGPAEPRSIGGDEVALCQTCYVAADTDRRLFIADQGNARILSVRMNYHGEERVALKDVADRKK